MQVQRQNGSNIGNASSKVPVKLSYSDLGASILAVISVFILPKTNLRQYLNPIYAKSSARPLKSLPSLKVRPWEIGSTDSFTDQDRGALFHFQKTSILQYPGRGDLEDSVGGNHWFQLLPRPR